VFIPERRKRKGEKLYVTRIIKKEENNIRRSEPKDSSTDREKGKKGGLPLLGEQNKDSSVRRGGEGG